MNRISALACAIAFVWSAVPASAGVVITQEQTLQRGDKVSHSSQQTVMVQGNKQKIIEAQRVVIIDLDQLKQFMLLPASKSYFELPIQPHSRMGRLTMPGRGATPSFDFKKTGKSRTVSGYKCNDYEASGQSMSGEYTTTQCFSKSAPGAAEYAAYQHALLDKMKTIEPAMNVKAPDGIPVASDSTITPERRRGTEARQESGSNPGAAHPPKLIHTQVTKIEKQDLPASTFAVPPDYKKVALGVPPEHGAANAPQSPGAEASPAAAPSAAAKPPGQ
jgi:hypothetical protein